MRPDLPELRRVLADIRSADRPARGLDAAVFLALGWEVRRGAEARHPSAWRMRSALSRLWIRVPEVSRDPLASLILLPADWEWTLSKRRRRAVAGVDNGEPVSVTVGGTVNPRRVAFEASAPALGLAALTVTIMALIALHERQDAAAPIREAA